MRKLRAQLCALAILAVPCAHAQWVEQSLDLEPGWNAVYLAIDPNPESMDAALQGARVESVWLWNRRFEPVEFLTEPSLPTTANQDWLVYMPPWMPQAATRTLNDFIGGRSYLIKSAESSRTVLKLTGKPASARPSWVGKSYNLGGLHARRAAAPVR